MFFIKRCPQLVRLRGAAAPLSACQVIETSLGGWFHNQSAIIASDIGTAACKSRVYEHHAVSRICTRRLAKQELWGENV